MIPIKLNALLEQAKLNTATPIGKVVQLKGVIFTPVAIIELLGIEGLGGAASFLDPTSHSETITVIGRIQPGVYINHVLPYKDKLTLEISIISGLNQTARRYAAIPLEIIDTNKESNNSALTNPGALDLNNFITVNFQLIDAAYYAMRNVTVSDNFLVGNIGDCLHAVIDDECQAITYEGESKYKGTKMRLPVDNDRVYRQISFKQGLPLTQVASYAQAMYGVYSSGLGSFFTGEGYWHIFSLFDFDSYDEAEEKLDILKMPGDVVPTLDSSYYTNGLQTTIVATGEASFISTANIDQQNQGTGQQILSSDALSGKTGTHYNNGRAIVTRQDSVTEYRTVERGKGELNDRIQLNSKVTNNVCREISNDRAKNGDILTIQWDNADFSKLTPGVPVKYFYVRDDQVLVSRKGKLAGYKYGYMADGVQGVLKFRRYVKLIIYLSPDEYIV